MYRLIPTSGFRRSARRFMRLHPNLQGRLDQILRDLANDPNQPHLRLHALHGELSGRHAVSLTRAYRITLILRTAEREIILLDIGKHDEVYR